MKKQIFTLWVTVLTVTVIAFSCSQQNKTENKEENPSVSFVWRGDTLGSSYYPYSAMLLPLKDDAAGTTNYFQFQTVLSNRLMYEDFVKTTDLKVKDNSVIFSGTVGNVALDSLNLTLTGRRIVPDDSIIGCVGLNVFENQCLLMDFSNQSIVVDKDIPVNETATPVKYEIYLEKKLLIPVEMDGKQYKFLLNPESPLYVIFNESPAKCETRKLSIGNKTFTPPEYQYIDDATQGFDGVLGYAFLKDKKVWIDLENNLLSVWACSDTVK